MLLPQPPVSITFHCYSKKIPSPSAHFIYSLPCSVDIISQFVSTRDQLIPCFVPWKSTHKLVHPGMTFAFFFFSVHSLHRAGLPHFHSSCNQLPDFILTRNTPSCIYTTISLSSYLFWQFCCCFKHLTIVNNALMDIDMLVSSWTKTSVKLRSLSLVSIEAKILKDMM